jgi:hypothetical protein
MATPVIGLAFVDPDVTERSVWVVIDPIDGVTGQRLRVPLDVRLVDVTAAPIAGLSGVYCFIDLDLAPDTYTARVTPLRAERTYFFDGETEFPLHAVPLPGQPLDRNVVTVTLLPRPAYPFSSATTLARGRLVRASDGSGISAARIDLVFGTFDELRGRTDERGDFVVAFPPAPPSDDPDAVPDDIQFTLRFVVDAEPPLEFDSIVPEGTGISLGEIQFPNI